MKVLIGALGVSKYDGTSYKFENGEEFEADLFLYALARHIEPDRVIAIVTEEAEQKTLPYLQEWMNLDSIPLTAVRIPNGATSSEAWDIFNKIEAKFTELLQQSEASLEVFIDITYGFRSIPILFLSIARYLQRTKDVQLGGIFYGAYDAVPRDQNLKPVYKLDSFITVLDWATAVDTFRKTGSSVQLADMLDIYGVDFELPVMQEVAQALRELSQALDLVRIEDAHQSAYNLIEAVKAATPEAVRESDRLILALLKQLSDEFEIIALASPRKDIRRFIKANLELVFWYHDRNRYQDAMLVAREWMISYKMFNPQFRKRAYKNEEFFDYEVRREEENPAGWKIPERKKLAVEISELRNSLAHGGLSRDADAADMLSRIEKVMSDLRKIKVLL